MQSRKRARFATKTPKPKRRAEWQLQASIIAAFHQLEALGWNFTCAGDQNAARRGFKAAAIAKATGMTGGEPDIRLILPEGRVGWIELKAEGGTLSDAQIDRHQRYAKLGHHVHVLQADNDNDAVSGAIEILKKLIGKDTK